MLHTLLVHNGVSSSILPKLLPFHFTEVLKTIADLRKQKLIFNDGGIWRVTLQHYAAVRNQLAKAEFWISDK